MWPDGVVVLPPHLDDDLGFIESVEDLTIEQLVSELAVKGFHVAVFPRAARFDVGGLGTDRGDPRAERHSDELRPIV